jgi:hypothetical protein
MKAWKLGRTQWLRSSSKRHPPRPILRDFEEGFIGGDWGFFCAVQTATHTLDLAGFSEVPEMRTGHGKALELFRAHESPFLDEGPDMFHFLHQIVILSKPLHLQICAEVLTGTR